MTELATIPAPQITHVGAANIEATARALVDAHRIGEALCRTAFVPKHFQGKPDDAAAAILYGSTIGMDPVTALQNVYVIGGKPALYARTMAAIVMSHGHTMWTEEESEGRVTVAGQRNGSDKVERVTWTTQMADRAGYLSNAKYKSDPRSMLYARASGDVARRIAPDALLGMAHNVEELTVSERWDERPTPTPAANQGSAADRMGAVLGTTHTAEQITDTPEPLLLDPRSSLAKAMFAGMRDAGIDDKDDRLALCSEVTDRDIGSSTELTEDEARGILDHLAARPEADKGGAEGGGS